MTVIVVSRFVIKEGRKEKALRFIGELAGLIARNEPGTLRWDVYRTRDEHTYLCIEEFVDEAAIEAHANAPYMVSAMSDDDPDTEITLQDFTEELLVSKSGDVG